MAKLIRIKDSETGTEYWEDLNSFQVRHDPVLKEKVLAIATNKNKSIASRLDALVELLQKQK